MKILKYESFLETMQFAAEDEVEELEMEAEPLPVEELEMEAEPLPVEEPEKEGEVEEPGPAAVTTYTWGGKSHLKS